MPEGPEMTRILMLSNIYPTVANPTGGSFIESRTAALADVGVEVVSAAVGLRPRDEAGAVPVRFIDATLPSGRVRRVLFRSTPMPGNVVGKVADRVAALITSERVDGIMAHGMFTIPAGAVAAELSRRWGVPFTLHLHGSDVNYVMARDSKGFSGVMEDARASFFVSHALQRKAASLGFAGNRWAVTGNGVDEKVFSYSTDTLDAAAGTRMLFVGNLLEVKGADRLPAIMRAVLMLDPDARLTVVGAGKLREKLEMACQNLPVSFLGQRPPREVASCMRAADVVILPSRNEGWPTVINESYAVGTPVVASDVGGTAEAMSSSQWAVSSGDGFETRFAAVVLAAAAEGGGQSLVERAHRFGWPRIVCQELAGLGLGDGVVK